MKVETKLLNQIEIIPETSADEVILSHMVQTIECGGKVEFTKNNWIDGRVTFLVSAYEKSNSET